MPEAITVHGHKQNLRKRHGLYSRCLSKSYVADTNTVIKRMETEKLTGIQNK